MIINIKRILRFHVNKNIYNFKVKFNEFVGTLN